MVPEQQLHDSFVAAIRAQDATIAEVGAVLGMMTEQTIYQGSKDKASALRRVDELAKIIRHQLARRYAEAEIAKT